MLSFLILVAKVSVVWLMAFQLYICVQKALRWGKVNLSRSEEDMPGWWVGILGGLIILASIYFYIWDATFLVLAEAAVVSTAAFIAAHFREILDLSKSKLLKKSNYNQTLEKAREEVANLSTDSPGFMDAIAKLEAIRKSK